MFTYQYHHSLMLFLSFWFLLCSCVRRGLCATPPCVNGRFSISACKCVQAWSWYALMEKWTVFPHCLTSLYILSILLLSTGTQDFIYYSNMMGTFYTLARRQQQHDDEEQQKQTCVLYTGYPSRLDWYQKWNTQQKRYFELFIERILMLEEEMEREELRPFCYGNIYCIKKQLKRCKFFIWNDADDMVTWISIFSSTRWRPSVVLWRQQTRAGWTRRIGI